MTHVITSLCVREGSCLETCPVECIVPGQPIERWPLYYIDPETCIDCGACVNACPLHAIYPLDEVPFQYNARGGEIISKSTNHTGYDEVYKGVDCNNQIVLLSSTRKLNEGESIDFSDDIQTNRDYFDHGPGYSAFASKKQE